MMKGELGPSLDSGTSHLTLGNYPLMGPGFSPV